MDLIALLLIPVVINFVINSTAGKNNWIEIYSTKTLVHPNAERVTLRCENTGNIRHIIRPLGDTK